jgi:class 3 adenylate cyclase
MKRKIAAIMAADIAGYSKLVAEDEEETLRRLSSYRAVFEDFISRFSGRIFNTAGDAVLAEFPSAVEAVRCTIDVQESLRTRNLAYPPSRQMSFRIGITIGDVVERDGDLLGDGVNIAARLEGLAQPGGLCVSRSVYEQVTNKLSVEFVDIGEQEVKNIPTPIHAYTLALGAGNGQVQAQPWRKRRRGAATSVWGAAIAAAGVTALAAAIVFYFTGSRTSNRTVTAAPPSPAAPIETAIAPAPPQRQAEALVPEAVPFIAERARAAIRNEYLPAPDHKALAISLVASGFITDQKDDDTAKTAALRTCQRAQDTINSAIRCEIYAVGNTVVFTRGRPPMPPEPWLVRDPSIETPLAVKDIPFVNENIRGTLDRFYRPAPKPKALAVSPRGNQGSNAAQTSIEEAMRRSLEACGSRAGVACMIIAVDDVFVVPIPTTMKAVGFFRAAGNAAIAPEAREDVIRRIRNAASGWNAVAVGASGRPGLMLKAANEQDAVDGALADCSRQGQACRVIAIGPFAVEPK